MRIKEETSSGPLGHLLKRRRVNFGCALKVIPFSFGEGARRADEVPSAREISKC
jgi:hypothetical protein